MDLEYLGPVERLKCVPKCAQCKNHNTVVPRKGHKGRCPWFNCHCAKCTSTLEKREYSAKRQKHRRILGQLPPNQKMQKNVKLLLNLNVQNREEKRKAVENSKDVTGGTQERLSQEKLKYRFSGTIKNNMFYPAQAAKSTSAQLPSIMSFINFEDNCSSKQGPEKPFVRKISGSHASCHVCTFNDVDQFYPATRPMQCDTTVNSQPSSLEGQLGGQQITICNDIPGQASPLPDIFWMRPHLRYCHDYLLDMVPQYQYYSPSPSVRYPFNANIVSQNSINFKFMDW